MKTKHPMSILTSSWSEATEHFTAVLNPFLQEQIDTDVHQQPLHDAMAYTLASGGKRLRPVLAWVVSQLGQSPANITDMLFPTGAIELIQTYSLIHDDLPAMDNDNLRRGKPSNHVKFGEAQAILAGDGLLTLAFSWLARASLNSTDRVAMVQVLANAAGPAGMVAGQSQDMVDTAQPITAAELQQLITNKTAQLIVGSVQIGVLAAHLTTVQQTALTQFALQLGRAFQIRDDILDVTETTAQLGKTAGKDIVEQKNTYPSHFGLAGAQAQFTDTITAAKAVWTPALLASFNLTVIPPVLVSLMDALEKGVNK
ncbi:polyprenyl synthetase family protein [Schleiferilactobacillus perolens]|nr:farnesyl diphosphate synthase [Schleiferilactobacillus perolens]